MLQRWLSCLFPLVLVVAPVCAHAGDNPQTPPTVVVRLRSLDSVLDSVKLFAGAIGKDELTKQIEGLLKSKTGPDGLVGVDQKRPLGLYAKLGKDLTDFQAVVLVPVSDEKAFVGLVESLGGKTAKGKDGVYAVKQDALPLDIFFRFANRYAYLTFGDAGFIEPKSLLAPADLFPANQKAALSLTLRIDQIPDGIKQMFLTPLDAALTQDLAKKDPKTTDAQHAFKAAIVNELQKKIAAVFKDGTELNAMVDIDPKTKELTAEVSLASKSGSELAKFVEQLGKTQSLFGGLLHKDAALNGLVLFALPEPVKEALNSLVDEAARKVLADTPDVKRKEQAERFLNALTPTLKSGAIDLGFSLRGPSDAKRYTLVAGLRLKDGKKLEAVLGQLLDDLPESEKALVKFNIAKVGAVGIYSLDLSKGLTENVKKVFGAHPLYFALRDDAVFLGMGAQGLDALKEALAAPASASPPLVLEMSLARMVEVMAKTDAQKQIALKLFTGSDEGRLRIAVEGGTALRARLTMQLSVLQWFAQLAASGAGGAPKKDTKD